VSEVLQVLGCVAAAAAVALALLIGDRRIRAAALLCAMGFALALIAGQGWDELESLRDRPAAFAGAALAALVVLAALTAAMLRWPVLLPLLLVAALPFRIPIDVGGGEDANLLVPLYAVIGAGVLRYAITAWRDPEPARSFPLPLTIALVAALCLYAIQASYSNDLDFAARNVGFFLIPFAVMFCLLAEVRWTRALLTQTLLVVLGEALLFAVIGVGQHVAGDIFWNPKLDMSNDFHFYFRVNSLFWDPNIFGRYLALAIVIAAAVLVWLQDRRHALLLVGAIVIAFAGLLTTFSQTSFIALLCGLAVVCALRWSLTATALVAPVVALVAAAGVLVVGDTDDRSAREVTEGHSTLIEGGFELARERPVYGYGSASFSESFSEAEDVKKGETTSSHNEPITVAAEQGAIGILAYLTLIGISLWTLIAGMRRIAPGLGARFGPIDSVKSEPPFLKTSRVMVVAAFGALLVHTIGYAGYLTDPLTWALLAIGAALFVQTGAELRVPGWLRSRLSRSK
jgi:putative inorganic carbon (HCO3(-)) transporter